MTRSMFGKMKVALASTALLLGIGLGGGASALEPTAVVTADSTLSTYVVQTNPTLGVGDPGLYTDPDDPETGNYVGKYLATGSVSQYCWTNITVYGVTSAHFPSGGQCFAATNEDQPVSYSGFSGSETPARYIDQGAVVSLDASASYDEGVSDVAGIASYNWAYVGATYAADGLPAYGMLSEPFVGDGATISFTAPEVSGRANNNGSDESEGIDLMFTLSVTDDDGLESPSIYMTFRASNTLQESGISGGSGYALTGAIARAGADQTVHSGEEVLLDGSASPWSVSNSGGTCVWSTTEDVTIFGHESSGVDSSGRGDCNDYARFIAPTVPYNGVAQDLLFSYTLDDKGDGTNMDTDTMIVTVLPELDDEAPEIVFAGGANQDVDSGVTVTLDGSGSTDNIGITDYAWSFLSSTDPSINSFTDLGVSGLTGSSLNFGAPTLEIGGDDVVLVLGLTASDDGQYTEDGIANSTTEEVTITVVAEVDTEDPVARTEFGDRDIASGTVAVLELDGTPSEDNLEIEDYDWALTKALIDGETIDDANALDTLEAEINLTASTTGTKVSFNVPTVAAGEEDAELTFTLTVADAAGNDDTVEVTITIKAEVDEDDPIAAMTITSGGTTDDRDRDVNSEALVELDGSISEDNVGIEIYEWEVFPENIVTLTGANTATPSFTAPTVLAGGEEIEFDVILTVMDDLGNEDTAEVTITVLAGDDIDAPEAIVEVPEITVASGTSSVELNGLLSEDNVEITSYDWTLTEALIDGETITDANELVALEADFGLTAVTGTDGAIANFDAPEVESDAANTELTFTLTVKDAANNEATAGVIVTVEAEELETIAPEAVIAGGDITVASGAEVSLDGSSSSDNTGIIDSYAWAATPANLVTLDIIDEKVLTFTAPIVPYGEDDVDLEVTLTVFDAANNMGTDTITITVQSETLPDNAPTVAQTQDAIANLMQARVGHVVSAQPDLIGLLSGTSSGTFNANVTQGSGGFNFASSGERRIWSRAQGSWSSSGDTENSYYFGAVGGHFDLSPNAIAGLMFEFDSLTQDNGTTNSSGSGYMVGPYFVAKSPNQPLFFEGRYLLGAASNSTSINGAEEQDFDTSRSLIQVKVAGQIVSNTTTWTPSLSFSQAGETQKTFTDVYGREIAEQGIGVTNATFGLDFAKPIPVQTGEMQLTGGMSGSWSASNNSGYASALTPDYEGGSASLHLGTVYSFNNGVTLSGDMSYGGLFSDYQSLGLSAGFTREF